MSRIMSGTAAATNSHSPEAARMEQLIPVINRLQDVMSTVGANGAATVDLPQIAVVGAQSVGKSSVLESIIAKDFLPRGSGIVTRRPLILQLRNVQPPASFNPAADFSATSEKSSQQNRRQNIGETFDNEETNRSEHSAVVAGEKSKIAELIEWGEFSHLPEVKFEDFDAIRKEIEKETDRVTAKNKGISPLPILLKIYSPHVIDLTLIDLPGIIKVPVGDQPPDIELQIRRMIYSFISRPNCIILAVTAANTDLANSDALQMAREVDPEGRRTLGVITKCDLMDEDTDALDMLQGKVYPLSLGYVGVVCRSQKDINKKTEIRYAFREEERFFRTHPTYRSIAHRCGTRHLAVTLNQILMHHIQQTLPELIHRIHSLVQEYETELHAYGDPLIEAQENSGALLLHFFSKFTRNFQDAIDGHINLLNCGDQLTGGARINYIFHDWFGKALSQFNPLDGLSDLEVRIAIKNATGPKAALFVPERAFEILVRKQIRKLEAPALRCVEQVYEELQRIVEKCELPEMQRFSVLRQRLLEVVKGVLKRCLGPTNQMISNLIQMELAYFNTNHPDFVGGNRASQFINDRVTATAAAASAVYPTSMSPDSITYGRQLQQQQQPQQQKLHQQLMFEQQILQEAAMLVSGNNNAQPAATQQQQQQRSSLPQILPPPSSASTTTNTPEHPVTPSQSISTAAPAPDHSSAMAQQPPTSGGFLNFFKSNKSAAMTNDPPAAAASQYQNSNFNSASNARAIHTQEMESSHQPLVSSHHAQQLRPGFTPQSKLSTLLSVPSNSQFSSYSTFSGLQLPQVPNAVAPTDVPSEREKTEIELIKSLIYSYFSIVRKNVADYVPKSIMSFMVNTAKECIQRELVSQLYKQELFEDLLREGEEVAEARKQCKATLMVLKTAMQIINQLRDYDLDEF